MTGRMFCYSWYSVNEPNVIKFGERWVKDGLDPKQDCLKRIRESLGVKKHSIDRGEVIMTDFWDVSELSKKVNRNFKRSRMDDFIRGEIPLLKFSRMETTGEEHKIEVELGETAADKVSIAVSEYLSRVGQPLPVVGLSPWQVDVAEDVIQAVSDGKRTILAELCARFGKTLWSGALIRELEIPVTIIVSYVLTSFTSFKKELRSFEQFRDLVLIDSSDDEYKKRINDAVSNGQQVVIFVSMCKGAKRQGKLDFLFDIQAQRMVIVDEADFGMKNVNQSKPLSAARRHDDIVILMTGTNADEAGQFWPAAHYVGCTYPELLIEKRDYADSVQSV